MIPFVNSFVNGIFQVWKGFPEKKRTPGSAFRRCAYFLPVFRFYNNPMTLMANIHRNSVSTAATVLANTS